MSIDRKNADVNHQDHPHQEGQQNNTHATDPGVTGQKSNNNNKPMSSMMNDSGEQRTGSSQGQQDERGGQQDERQS